jgi:hypothetical protein
MNTGCGLKVECSNVKPGDIKSLVLTVKLFS